MGSKNNSLIQEKLKKGFMGVGAIQVISIPISLMVSIILARSLGPELYGQYAFAVAFLPLLALPVSGGLTQLLTRQVATYVHNNNRALYKGIIVSSYTWVIATSLVIIIGYFLASEVFYFLPRSNEGEWRIMIPIMLMIPVMGLNSVRTGLLKGMGYPILSELPIRLLQPAIVLITYYFLANIGQLTGVIAVWIQLWSGVTLWLIGSILIFYINLYPKQGYKCSYELKMWMQSLLPFSMMALVYTCNTQVGVLILGVLGSDESVAAMQVGQRGAQFVSLSLGVVNMVVSPYIVSAYQAADMKRLQALSKKTARLALLFSIPVALILLVFGDSILGHLFGMEYVEIAYVPLVILVVAQLVNVFFGSVGQLLAMTGHEKNSLRCQVVSIGFNVVLCVVLIPEYGAIGAAIASAVALVLWNIMLAKVVVNKLSIRPTAV